MHYILNITECSFDLFSSFLFIIMVIWPFSYTSQTVCNAIYAKFTYLRILFLKPRTSLPKLYCQMIKQELNSGTYNPKQDRDVNTEQVIMPKKTSARTCGVNEETSSATGK